MKHLISDVKGTLTYFDKHIAMESKYYEDNALRVYKDLGYNIERANKEFQDYLSKKDNPDYKLEIVHKRDIVCEQGYKKGELSLEDIIKPETEKLLQNIKGKVILVAMSKAETTKASMESVGLDQYIDSYYVTSEVGSKEDGTAYKTIAEEENINLENTIYLDDKQEHVKGAQKAGVKKVIHVTNETDFDEIIEELEDE